MTDMRSNTKIAEFLDRLNTAGVMIRRLWETRRDEQPASKKNGYHRDVTLVEFIGSGFSPSINVAIIVDYGEGNGFGFFTDSGLGDFDEMVAAISKPRN